MGYLDRSPLAKLKRPPKRHRGTCLSHEQWNTVLAEVGEGDPFYDFLQLLLETGTRPQQARLLAARHCNFAAKLVHFADGEVPERRVHKTSRSPTAPWPSCDGWPSSARKARSC